MAESVPAPELLSADDADLAARIRIGDREAFTCLVDEHLDGAMRLAHRYLHSRDAALDCAQTMFARLWEHHEQFHPRQSVKSYVLSAVYRQALNDVRYRKRRPDTMSEVEMSSEIASVASHEDAVVNRATVETILALLPDRKRVALQLRYVEQLSLAEVAEVLGISRPAAERTVNRTLDALRRRLHGSM